VLNLNHKGGSRALVLGSIWTGLVHVLLAVLGTFVLKRFPTSFAVGFLLGVLIVLANQNFILFGVFHGYSFGNTQTNHIFSSLCFTLSMVLLFFSVLVLHFRNDLVLAPVDVGQVKEGTEEAAFDYRQQERV
jgi:zinc transporter ZupT